MKKLTEEDVKNLLANPIYAFGTMYDKNISLWTKGFACWAPKTFWELPSNKQEIIYSRYLKKLEERGYVKSHGKIETIIPFELWIKAQHKLSEELEQNVTNELLSIREVIKSLLNATTTINKGKKSIKH